MMNGNYGSGGMNGGFMGGGWMMIIGVLVCIVIIGAIIWLVMRALKNKQVTPPLPLPQQQPPDRTYEQGYQPPLQQSTGTYQEGGKPYSYPQPGSSPQQQEQPLN